MKSSLALQHIPIIMLTGYGGDTATVAGLDAGADDFLMKPFSPAELRARVRAACRASHLHGQLRSLARRQGMSDVASSVLHDIGNVLNSVNVSSSLVMEKLRRSESVLVSKAAVAIAEYVERDVSDERARKMARYLSIASRRVCDEASELKSEVELLRGNLEHIKVVIDTQQSHVHSVGLREVVSLADVVEDAFRITADAFSRTGVELERVFQDIPAFAIDRHRVLEILLNLLINARQAVSEESPVDRKVTVEINGDGRDYARIIVTDTGVGIRPENMNRIFEHGFTTKRDGHGFGLHSSANAARALGGSLRCESEGPGRGARFTLELAIQPHGALAC